jgi:hypothetical protein
MKRHLWLLLAMCAPLTPAAIFPEQIATFTRGTVTAIQPPDRQFFEELGFKEAEQAEYQGPGGRFRVTGWKVADSTAALALYEARRPAQATPSGLARLAAKTPAGFIAAYGNFVFEYDGHIPDSDEFEGLLVQLKNVERSALPTLIQYLPEEDLIANSERYILGPVTLERFLPQVSPSLAAFHLAAEGQQGRYQTPAGELTLTIFSYPTPNIARERQEAFLRLPGVMAKRAGSLVAVIVSPPDPDAAERILARVRYEVDITRQRIGRAPAQGLANLILTAFLLVGVLLAASLVAGIWLGGFRAIFKKFGWVKEQEPVTVLRIPHD